MRLTAALLLTLLAAPAAQAQITPPASSVNVYRYAEPGQRTMEVGVWGAVRTPGIYQVVPGTDLLRLLSFAGGPASAPELATQERAVHVRLSRPREGRRALVFDARLEELVEEEAALPELQDGDVLALEVSVRQRFGWRDGLQVFSSVGTLAVIVLNIVRLSR